MLLINIAAFKKKISEVRIKSYRLSREQFVPLLIYYSYITIELKVTYRKQWALTGILRMCSNNLKQHLVDAFDL